MLSVWRDFDVVGFFLERKAMPMKVLQMFWKQKL
jgi:hypothetical protein